MQSGARAFIRKAEASVPLRVDGGTEKLLQCLYIFSESLTAGFCHAIQRLRLALDKLLFDGNIAGFFELEKVRAKIAVGRAGLGTEPGKLCFLDAGEQREQSQAQLPVNHGIELGQIRHGRCLVRVCAITRPSRKFRRGSDRRRSQPETRYLPGFPGGSRKSLQPSTRPRRKQIASSI